MPVMSSTLAPRVARVYFSLLFSKITEMRKKRKPGSLYLCERNLYDREKRP